MSTIADLLSGQRAMIAALDADDRDAIERATADVAASLAAFAGAGASRPQAEEAVRLAHTARAMLNLLADRTEGRLSRLTQASGRGGPATYGRDARLRRA